MKSSYQHILLYSQAQLSYSHEIFTLFEKAAFYTARVEFYFVIGNGMITLLTCGFAHLLLPAIKQM